MFVDCGTGLLGGKEVVKAIRREEDPLVFCRTPHDSNLGDGAHNGGNIMLGILRGTALAEAEFALFCLGIVTFNHIVHAIDRGIVRVIQFGLIIIRGRAVVRFIVCSGWNCELFGCTGVLFQRRGFFGCVRFSGGGVRQVSGAIRSFE